MFQNNIYYYKTYLKKHTEKKYFKKSYKSLTIYDKKHNVNKS